MLIDAILVNDQLGQGFSTLNRTAEGFATLPRV